MYDPGVRSLASLCKCRNELGNAASLHVACLDFVPRNEHTRFDAKLVSSCIACATFVNGASARRVICPGSLAASSTKNVAADSVTAVP